MRDFGRFGQFVLDGAKVKGESIVPDGWLAEATSAKLLTDVPGKNGYAYQWWTVKPEAGKAHEGVFMGRGIHGQYLYINPAQHIVVVGLGARPKPVKKKAIDDLNFLAAIVEKLSSPWAISPCKHQGFVNCGGPAMQLSFLPPRIQAAH